MNKLGRKLEKLRADKLEKENKSLRRSWSRSHTCNSIERMRTPIQRSPIIGGRKKTSRIRDANTLLWDEIFRLWELLTDLQFQNPNNELVK